ncbi:hypothetical protein YC2023_045618 [Brassica napus]
MPLEVSILRIFVKSFTVGMNGQSISGNTYHRFHRGSLLTQGCRDLQSGCLGFVIDRGIARFPGDGALLSHNKLIGLDWCVVAVSFTGYVIHFDQANL